MGIVRRVLFFTQGGASRGAVAAASLACLVGLAACGSPVSTPTTATSGASATTVPPTTVPPTTVPPTTAPDHNGITVRMVCAQVGKLVKLAKEMPKPGAVESYAQVMATLTDENSFAIDAIKYGAPFQAEVRPLGQGSELNTAVVTQLDRLCSAKLRGAS